MIIVNLKGGLGNQMFQYALGRKLSLKNNDELKLEVVGLDRANEVGDIYRPFSLGRFNIEKNIASPEEVQKLKYPYGILSKGLRWFNFKILRKTHSLFEPEVLTWTGNIFLDGYWQSPRYFDDIRDTLLEDFTLAEPLDNYATNIVTLMKNSNSVSIHIRRGDYIKPQVLKEFGICTETYYQKAVAAIEEKLPNAHYFIFSDDIDWVKENLKLGAKATYVTDPDLTDTAELCMMSLCKHNIIANSTFSWWSAWLNRNPNKIVIAPEPWFDNTAYDPDLLPSNWLTLPK